MVSTSESTGGIGAVRATGLLPIHRPFVLQLTCSKQTRVDDGHSWPFQLDFFLSDRHQVRDCLGPLLLFVCPSQLYACSLIVNAIACTIRCACWNAKQ